MNTYQIYTKNNGLILCDLNYADVLRLVTLDEDELNKLIEEDTLNYNGNLSFNEYLYLCVKYIYDNKLLFPGFIKKISKIKDKLFYIEKIDEILQYNDREYGLLFLSGIDKNNYKYDFRPDDELLKAFLSNMDKSYDSIEKIAYYYFKSCFLLQTDSTLNFISQINSLLAGKYRKNFDNLYNINSNNNEATCFEIVEILKYLARLEGAVVLDDNISNYGKRTHVIFKAVLDKTYMEFDSLSDIKPYNDIISVKLNLGFKGIVIKSDDTTIKDKINKVYDDVQKEFENKENKSRFSKSNIISVFNFFDNLNIDELTKEVLKKYVLLFDKFKLNKVEYYAQIIRHRLSLINDTNYKADVIIVCKNDGEYGFNAILSIRQKDNDFVYIKIDEENLEVVSKEEILRLIKEDILIITKCRFDKNSKPQYNFILGIDEEIQIKNNDRAAKYLLPKLFKELKGEGEMGTTFKLQS